MTIGHWRTPVDRATACAVGAAIERRSFATLRRSRCCSEEL